MSRVRFSRLRTGFALIALPILALGAVMLALTPPVWAVGGTNGLFNRMESMVAQMAESGELTPEEVVEWKLKIKELRGKVEERVKENGGGMNIQRDKDLYDEIDAWNKPLFEKYQGSKARKPHYNPKPPADEPDGE